MMSINDDARLDGQGPLAGIRVLEMGQLIAGPFAGQILAAYGAEVVKIEPPGRGDPLRTWRELDATGTSYWWRSLARNKQSVTLDLAGDEGRDLARQLVMQADVLIENFRPGRMEAWGLGPATFQKTHPGLIYTRVSGYGQTGPDASRPGFASACEAAAGLRHVNGHPDAIPVRLNLSLGDTLAGMHAAMGVLLALLAQQRAPADGGVAASGQVVDVSIIESVFNMMEGVLPEYDGAGIVREASGTTVSGIVPTNTYRCSDGRCVVIGGNGDTIFKRLMEAIGHGELADDARLTHNPGRVRHEAEIDAVLAEWCGQRDAASAMAALDAAAVPNGPVNSIADITLDPQFQARGCFEPVDVHGEERLMPAMHPKLLDTPAETHWCGPDLGAHTSAVLTRWLGLDEPAIAEFRRLKVV